MLRQLSARHARRLIGLILLSVGVAGTAQPQSSHVSIEPLWEQTLKVSRGQSLAVPLKVTNLKEEGVALVEEIEAPGSWVLLAGGDAFDLGPGESVTRLVTLIAPSRIVTEDAEATYRLVDRNGRTLGELAIPIEMEIRYGLKLDPVDVPDRVVAGIPSTARYLVQNIGDRTVTVSITVVATEWQAHVTEPEVTIPSGGTAEVVVEVSPPRDLRRQEHRSVMVVAAIKGQPEVEAKVFSVVSALPQLEHAGLDYHRMPMQMELSSGVAHANHMGSYAHVQANAQGRGKIWEGGNTTIAFRLQTPTLLSIENPFTSHQRDHYSVSVEHAGFRVMVGDQWVQQSVLYGSGGTGFGASGSVNVGSLRVGARWLEDRHSFFGENTVGGEAAFEPISEAKVGLNYLSRSGSINGDAVGANLVLKPVNWLEGDFEYAVGRLREADSPATAYRLSVSGGPRFARARLEYTAAESGFPSWQANSDQLNSSVLISPAANWTISGTARMSSRGNIGVTTASARRQMHHYYVQASYRQRFFLALQGLGGRMELGSNIQHGAQDHVEARVTLGPNRLRITGKGILGRTVDRMAETSELLWGGGAQVQAQPLPDVTLDVAGEYTVGGNAFAVSGSPRQEALRLNASIRYQVVSRFRVEGVASFSEASFGEVSRSQHTFLRVAYDLPWNNSIQLDAGSLRHKWGDRPAHSTGQVLLRYNIPVGVPVHRQRSTGLIRGSLIDETSGQGLAGVPVLLDHYSAITTPAGEFALPGVPPGEYVLHVRPPSTEASWVIREGNPVPVTARGGEISEVRLTTARAADVRARIVLAHTQASSETTASRAFVGDSMDGMPGVVFELSGGETRMRQISDAHGNLRFGQLGPGRYTVRMLTAFLPARHHPDEERIEFELSPGESKELVFRVTYRPQTVRYVTEEEIDLMANTAWRTGEVSSEQNSDVRAQGREEVYAQERIDLAAVSRHRGSVLAGLALRLMALGEGDRAVEVLREGEVLQRRSLQADASDPWKLFVLAEIGALRGDVAAATNYLRQSLASGLREATWFDYRLGDEVWNAPVLASLRGHPDFERLVGGFRLN